MSARALPSVVTGDYSLDDFLDAGARGDPDGDDDGDDDEREEPPADADGPDRPTGSDAPTDAEAPADAEPSADSADDDVEAEPADVGSEPADGDPLPPESVDPAEPTYGWSPEGAECAGCGEPATTRWRQDGEYVCADCKEW